MIKEESGLGIFFQTSKPCSPLSLSQAAPSNTRALEANEVKLVTARKQVVPEGVKINIDRKPAV